MDRQQNKSSILDCSEDEIIDLQCPALYFNRELSWLEFNARVLENALDHELPLLEQLKFLSIFHNNLDEFFMVRVANIFRQYSMGAPTLAPDNMTPVRQLAEIRKKVMQLLNTAHNHWNKYLKIRLSEKNINLASYTDLSDKQQQFLHSYFKHELYPILTPQAIDPSRPLPSISNISLNFIIQLEGAEDGLYRFARLRCPSNTPRFIFVPRNKEAKGLASLGLGVNVKNSDIVLLEEIIAQNLHLLFPGYHIVSYGLFRITRNTDFEIEEDEADDLLEAVKDLIGQRRFGDVVRLETTHGMSAELTDFLMKKLHLKPIQIYRVKGPLAFADMIGLYSIDKPALKEEPFQGWVHPAFLEDNIFSYLKAHDVVLNHPYDSFSPVVEFVRTASHDPKVVAIKQTLYRVGNDSPIVRSLIEARRLGKQVTAVVELKARFDEERNITWAEELEKEGVNVVYGLVGMKIHSKLCLVVRKEPNGVTRYVHIGTGNYNPVSAKLYTDMSLFTSNDEICSDVTDIFNAITGYASDINYHKLMVSPSNMRTILLSNIQNEIIEHQKNGNGHIILKCNQLVDKFIIRALYQASMAGVRVELLIRGICCLIPGVPQISENIFVKSIVGRFLEHSRIYYFNNNGENKVYIGSADLMPRNLDRRVEVCAPILNSKAKKYILEILKSQLADNSQAWVLNEAGSYIRVIADEKEKIINSQDQLMFRKKV